MTEVRMPRLVLANEQIRVYDDLLPQDAFDALLHHATADTYNIVHSGGWRKVWRLGDGLPLQGSTKYFFPDGSGEEIAESLRYPTQTPVDAFIEAIDAVAGEAADLVGPAGTWRGITVAPWVYPIGTGLSLHRDHHHYTGSYTYFIHREWNFHWGGQLLILDPRTGAEGDPDLSPLWPHWLSDVDENRTGLDPGLATCVLPKPNRLVVIAPHVYHMVTRVDANAGNRPRVTLAGFFLKPKETS
jgi:hypothetical protein